MTSVEPGSTTQLPPQGKPAAATAPNPDALSTQHDFTFTGSGGEYFRIWIVNLALSILTLGIYSAWATVRTRKYFYGNTHLAGSAFEYLATPMAILKGRLIAVAVFAVYLIVGHFYPTYQMILTVLIWLLIPIVIVQSLSYRAQSSAYRGVRLAFNGDKKSSYASFLGWPLLIPFTFGLIVPFVIFKQAKFVAGNHRFGGEAFSFSAKASQYYGIYLGVFLLMLGLGLGLGVLIPLLSSLGALFLLDVLILAIVPFYLVVWAIGGYLFIRQQQLLFNHTQIGSQFSFKAQYSARSWIWLLLSNTLLLGLTLGLYYPWAKVRTAKFRVQNLALNAQTDLDHFVDQNLADTKATGEELGDIFSVEVGV